MNKPPASIRVTIDSIALRGIAPSDRAPLVEALQVELQRTLSDPRRRADLMQSRRLPVVRLGRMPFAGGPSAGRDLGRKIGRGIGAALGGRKERV
jgi:hypothetical protein